MRRPTLALLVSQAALAAVLAGCERDPEADHVLAIRALCADLAAERPSPEEAAPRLGGPPDLAYCADALPLFGAGDRCPRGQGGVCALVWAYRARSPTLCGGVACSYGCELRVLESAPATTCAVRSVTGEERAPTAP